MVVQRTIDSLKEKPHEEKRVVAGGIAIGIVVILLIGWGFIFLRNIQRGAMPTLQGSTVPEDQLNTDFIRQTQQQINQYYQSSAEQLRNIRDSAASGGTNVEAGAGVTPNGGSGEFGAQNDF